MLRVRLEITLGSCVIARRKPGKTEAIQKQEKENLPEKRDAFKSYCYTYQLNHVFRLEENVSRAVGQNSLTSCGEQNSLTPQGNNNMNFRLARDQVVLLQRATNLRASRREAVFCTFELGGIIKPRPQC